jgi:hypothetical protein
MENTNDKDLKKLNSDELIQEILTLRNSIRNHRDAEGNDRCWLDDIELYQKLPEGKNANFTLPEKEEFLKNCAVYHENRCPKSNVNVHKIP